jgi:hypothetical protein
MPLSDFFGVTSVDQTEPAWSPMSIFGKDALAKAAKKTPKYSYDDMLGGYNSKIDFVAKKLGSGRSMENPEYDYNDVITLKTGKYNLAKIPKKLISDVMDTSKRTGVDFYDLLGLIGQESTFGGGLDQASRARGVTKRDLVSGWDLDLPFKPKDPFMFLADNKADGVKARKTTHGWTAEVVDEERLKKWVDKNPRAAAKYMELLNKTRNPESVNWLDEAANRIKEKGIASYNAGDKDYKNKVENSKKLLMADPVLKEFIQWQR